MTHEVDRDFPGVPIPGPDSTELFVRHWTSGTRSPRADRGRPAVLYVHGATFPSSLSVGYAIDGRSWAGEMAAAGLDVWSFDFVGYGSSSRYPEQGQDPVGVAPLGRAGVAAQQLIRVLEHVVRERGGGQVSLLAHSAGGFAAGLAATQAPDLVDRLALFAPFARRSATGTPDPASLGAWYPLTEQEQYDRFVHEVPAGHPRVLTDQYDQWAAEWLATDPTSGTRVPSSVRTPSGPRADILAAWSGRLPYRPELVQAPTCILRGEWDSICTSDDARALLDEFTSSPERRDVPLPKGTHLMHLESGRFALYQAATAFLLADRYADATG
jgi:pimeloyl-ACP methyl ester carboxylesterase